jgi:serine/threonine protein kinase
VPPPPGAAAASANARTTYAARVVDDSQEGDTGSADPLEGKRLGQYWLLKRLGRGAKGIVYLADDELLGRQVAVKVLSPELSAGDPISVQRFLLEARATSQISHANVISVYSVGRQDFGKESYIYIAMALVTGGSVLERLDAEGVYSPAEATRIVRQAALGLHAAHQLGIVHRDVKPANLLLGDNGEVKVADFGMAKMVDNSYSNLTEPGTLMGTPHYMSPEQCLGGAIDHRADIYSLGATYFRLLTGQTPFADMSPLAVAHKQVNDPHPDPRTVNPAVPGICVRIIDRALAKNPADRYQTAAEMAAALQVVETSLRQSEQMQEEAERPADRRGETIVVSERELADILNDSFGDDSETDSDSLRDVEPPPPAPSPSASRMFPKAALPQPAPMPSPRPAAPPPLLAPAPPRNGAASVTRMPAAPMPPPSGAFRTAPPYTPPAPGLPASHGRGGATEPSWMSLPVKAAFKLRYNTVEDVKKALGFLRKDVRDIARKVIAPTLVKGAKAAVLDITVCLSPTEHFGVIKTLVAAGGAFMGMECEDAEFQNWFRRQVSTLRPPR